MIEKEFYFGFFMWFYEILYTICRFFNSTDTESISSVWCCVSVHIAKSRRIEKTSFLCFHETSTTDPQKKNKKNNE